MNVQDAVGLPVKISLEPSLQVAQGSAALAIKGSGGHIGVYTVYNPNDSDVYILFYNEVAGSVSVGVTAPWWREMISGRSTGGLRFGTPGLEFTIAISCNAGTNPDGSGPPTLPLVRSVAFT